MINILDFQFNKVDDFHASYHLWEDQHKEIMLTDVCELHFLDINKFSKIKNYNLEDPLHRWMIFFNERSPIELIEEVLKMDENIQLVQEKLDFIFADENLRSIYDSYAKAELDQRSAIYAVEEKTAKRTAKDIAKRGLEQGFSIDSIIKLTELDEETVRSLI
jgi:predicted transposase/invertase (TIGR01784 family)